MVLDSYRDCCSELRRASETISGTGTTRTVPCGRTSYGIRGFVVVEVRTVKPIVARHVPYQAPAEIPSVPPVREVFPWLDIPEFVDLAVFEVDYVAGGVNYNV